MAAPDRSVLKARRDAGRSKAEVARLMGVDRVTVRNWCLKLDIALTQGVRSRPKWPQLQDPGWMLAQVEAGRSWADVDRELGCAEGTTKSAAAVLRRRGYDIPRRPSGFEAGGTGRPWWSAKVGLPQSGG